MSNIKYPVLAEILFNKKDNKEAMATIESFCRGIYLYYFESTSVISGGFENNKIKIEWEFKKKK